MVGGGVGGGAVGLYTEPLLCWYFHGLIAYIRGQLILGVLSSSVLVF